MSSEKKNSHDRHFGQSKLPGEHPYGDLGQIVFLALFLIVWGLDSFVFKFSTILTATIPLAVRLSGTALFLGLSFYLYRSSHHIVDEARRSERKLIQNGPFAKVRHPLYLSIVLLYLVFISATLSLAAFGLWLVIFLFYNFIAAYEEKHLLLIFGEEYSRYKNKVSRWLPF